MQTPKVLIFDFDGTLADTLPVAIGIFNTMSREFSFRPVEDDDLPVVRKMSTLQIMDYFGISLTSVPRIAARALKLLRERVDEILPFPEVPATLRALKERGFILGILTSNSEENVTAFLRRNDLEVFDFIQSSSRLLGKARVIRSILKRNRWTPGEVLLFGDECRDIEAAHKAKIPVAAVTWGFNTKETLEALSPTFVFDRPEDILDLGK